MSKVLEAIIGLEVHAQMSTKTKMFCACDNDAWGKPPNTTVCPICMGHPGTLPVPNREAIAKAIRAALVLGCSIAPDCHFDRKHYFYPDLPSGFQISQYDFPLARHGGITFDVFDASGRKVSERMCRIHRLHMENDAGKLTHRGDKTLCDYNRSGTPLMEIVTEPDLRSAAEAVAFAQELRRILMIIDASAADMFKGMMRFDASISLREIGAETLNPRSEIKNLNSFKALEKALSYEEQRLRRLWEESGGPLTGNITVGWLDEEGETKVLREKEEAQDYRYFPEPDIPPLHFDAQDLKTIRAKLPPLPRTQRQGYVKMGLEESQALQLMDDAELRERFDAVYATTKDAKRASGIVLTQLLGSLKAENKSIAYAPSPEDLVALVSIIDAGTISGNTGKDVLQKMVTTGKSAMQIVADEGLQQITDDSALEELMKKAIAANPKAIASYKAGKSAALGAVVGWVMKETRGQANPHKINELLRKVIE